MRPALTAAGVAAAAVAAGAPAWAGGPVWDDHWLLGERLAGLDAAGLAALWTSPVGGGEVGEGYYRPVAMTALALVGSPQAAHVLATALHATSAALLCRLGGRGGVVAGLLLALHPVAGEVLGWASALPDALALAGALGAAAALPAWPALAGLLVAGAVLSKETALVVAPLAALAAGRAPPTLVPLGAGAAAALVCRAAVGVGAGLPPIDRWALAPQALLEALGATLWPMPFAPVRDLRVSDPAHLGAGLLLALLLLVAARRAPAAVALAVLPVAMALPTALDGYLMADRYLYPGLAGLGLLAARAWPASPGRALRVGVIAFGGISYVEHRARAPQWGSDLALFSAAVDGRPTDGSAWHLLGEARARSGDLRGAADAWARGADSVAPYAGDRQRAIAALLEVGDADAALRLADAGPTEGLTADALAWWARAADAAGQPDRARALLAPLRGPGGWDGPPWVPALGARLGLPAPAGAP